MSFQAKDIMTTDIFAVKEDTDIYEAIQVLIEKKISGLPVINQDNELIGLLSEKDILELLYDNNPKKNTVGDYMSHKIIKFQPHDSLIDICECLIKSNFRRVPIVSENKKIVGVISRRDIIEYILKIRHKESSHQ